MSPAPVPDIAAVAGKLSERGKAALLGGSRIGGNNPSRAHIECCELGLADCTIHGEGKYGEGEAERWWFELKPLGLALRQHLLENGGG